MQEAQGIAIVPAFSSKKKLDEEEVEKEALLEMLGMAELEAEVALRRARRAAAALPARAARARLRALGCRAGARLTDGDELAQRLAEAEVKFLQKQRLKFHKIMDSSFEQIKSDLQMRGIEIQEEEETQSIKAELAIILLKCNHQEEQKRKTFKKHKQKEKAKAHLNTNRALTLVCLQGNPCAEDPNEVPGLAVEGRAYAGAEATAWLELAVAARARGAHARRRRQSRPRGGEGGLGGRRAAFLGRVQREWFGRVGGHEEHSPATEEATWDSVPTSSSMISWGSSHPDLGGDSGTTDHREGTSQEEEAGAAAAEGMYQAYERAAAEAILRNGGGGGGDDALLGAPVPRSSSSSPRGAGRGLWMAPRRAPAPGEAAPFLRPRRECVPSMTATDDSESYLTISENSKERFLGQESPTLSGMVDPRRFKEDLLLSSPSTAMKGTANTSVQQPLENGKVPGQLSEQLQHAMEALSSKLAALEAQVRGLKAPPPPPPRSSSALPHAAGRRELPPPPAAASIAAAAAARADGGREEKAEEDFLLQFSSYLVTEGFDDDQPDHGLSHDGQQQPSSSEGGGIMFRRRIQRGEESKRSSVEGLKGETPKQMTTTLIVGHQQESNHSNSTSNSSSNDGEHDEEHYMNNIIQEMEQGGVFYDDDYNDAIHDNDEKIGEEEWY